MSASKWISGLAGAFFSLLAIALLTGGGVLLWAYGTQRNDEGFISTHAAEVSAEGYALTSRQLDLGALPTEVFGSGWVATIEVAAESTSGEPIFVGLARSDDVLDYLAGVAHSEVSDIGGRRNITYTTTSGGSPDGLPSDQGFWSRYVEGAGSQSLTWDLESGDWTIVVMNADASPGIDIDLTGGARSNWVPIAMALLLGLGLVLAAVGALFLVVTVRGPKGGASAAPTEPAQPAALTGAGK